MSRFSQLLLVTAAIISSTNAAAQVSIQLKFTGMELLVADDVDLDNGDRLASRVRVLLPDLRSAAHPHFAQVRFGCDDYVSNCKYIVDLEDVDVRLLSSGGSNPGVTLDTTYDGLISFKDNLDYGEIKTQPLDLAATVTVHRGTLMGERACNYGFAAPDSPPGQYSEHYFRAVLVWTAGANETVSLELTGNGQLVSIPIVESGKAAKWLNPASVIIPIWIVNDVPPWRPASDLKHYTMLATRLGDKAPVKVPHRHSSCLSPPASGTSFCPPVRTP